MPDHWRTFNACSLLGGALAGQKKFVEAETLLVSGYEGVRLREGTIDADIKTCLKDALELLVQFDTDLGQPEKAITWKEKLSDDGASSAQVNASPRRVDRWAAHQARTCLKKDPFSNGRAECPTMKDDATLVGRAAYVALQTANCLEANASTDRASENDALVKKLRSVLPFWLLFLIKKPWTRIPI